MILVALKFLVTHVGTAPLVTVVAQMVQIVMAIQVVVAVVVAAVIVV